MSTRDLMVALEDAISNIDYPGSDSPEWEHKAKVLVQRVAEAAWSEGHAQAIANIAWPKERKPNPYAQPSEPGSTEPTSQSQTGIGDGAQDHANRSNEGENR